MKVFRKKLDELPASVQEQAAKEHGLWRSDPCSSVILSNQYFPASYMSINQRDIKLLQGRAASRCAFPNCRLQLTQDSETTLSSIPIGEQAHIVAKESNGPRGESLFTSDERDSYANLILLCPTHHTIIDKNSEDFPVEKLYGLKTVNWFREVVRRDINPMFFAAEGKFIATYPWSGDMGLSHRYLLPEYTQEEKDSLPDCLSEDEQPTRSFAIVAP